MISTSQISGSEAVTARTRDFLASLSWKSILAGTVAAIGIHLLLSALGVGAGLAAFSPATDSAPATHLARGAAIVWTICALVALAFGGFVAGRFSQSPRGGFTHGVLVWSLSLIITVLFISMGTGMVMGGALKFLGQGLQVAGNAAAPGLADMAKDATSRGGDQMNSFLNEATQPGQSNSSPAEMIRAKREIGLAVTKVFAPGNDINSPEARIGLKNALVKYGNMSEADAQNMITEWTQSYNELKADLDVAKAKAKDAADKASEALAHAGRWSFAGLLVGLLVTASAGSCGAHYSARHPDALLVTEVIHDGNGHGTEREREVRTMEPPRVDVK